MLHIEFFYTGSSILTRSLYPYIFPVVLQLIWFSSGSTVIVYFLEPMRERYSVPIRVVIFLAASILPHVGCSFECCHMVDPLSYLPGIILVWTVSFHYYVTSLQFFHFWDHMGLRFWCIRFFFNFHIWHFSLFGVTVRFLLLIGQKKMIGFLNGFDGWVSSGYDSTVGNI